MRSYQYATEFINLNWVLHSNPPVTLQKYIEASLGPEEMDELVNAIVQTHKRKMLLQSSLAEYGVVKPSCGPRNSKPPMREPGIKYKGPRLQPPLNVATEEETTGSTYQKVEDVKKKGNREKLGGQSNHQGGSSRDHTKIRKWLGSLIKNKGIAPGWDRMNKRGQKGS